MTVLETWSRASERIETRARELRFKQVALMVVAFIPFLLFFSAYFVWRAVWLTITWLWSAGIEGWSMAKTMGSDRS